MRKMFVFGLLTAIMPAVAEEAADRKTATSLKYVEHELSTRQNKFTAEQNKAMEYTNSAGAVEKRTVKSDLGSDTSDTSLPMVGGVNTKLNQKQDDIDPVNDHTAVTYTGQPGGIGRKGIYQATGTYAEQSDNLIDAKTFNAALKTGLDNEFKCREDNLDPVSGLCWLYTIHNNTEYVSAAGTVTQDGTPTPENPIYPVFYQQDNLILRRVDDYADSYDATTHKITRRVGVKVLDGTEEWLNWTTNGYYSNFPRRGNYQYDADAITSAFAISRTDQVGSFTVKVSRVNYPTIADFEAYLAEQYAAGTPVTVYYPLATPVEEDWNGETIYIPQNQ